MNASNADSVTDKKVNRYWICE